MGPVAIKNLVGFAFGAALRIDTAVGAKKGRAPLANHQRTPECVPAIYRMLEDAFGRHEAINTPGSGCYAIAWSLPDVNG